MALSRFDIFARSVVGPSAAGAQVYLCLQPSTTSVIPPSPLAQLYADPLGATPITQPLVCDGFGHAFGYVASGTFTEVIVYGGTTMQVYPDQFFSSTVSVQVNGLEVNGNPVTGPNFNSTTPSIPTGSSAVNWQFDLLGNVSGSVITSSFAPLASPVFTGTPKAPTPASSDNSTTLATTQYVQTVVLGLNLVTSVFGRTGAVAAQIGDYSVAQITGAAPLSSPGFSGTPTAPTPTISDNSSTLATTAYVKEQGYGFGTITNFSAGNIGTVITTTVATATSTPALTFTLATQSANTVWAGPTSGGAAAPTFRALVVADIPGAGGVPGGSDTQVQFNNASAFGGSNLFTWTSDGILSTVSPTLVVGGPDTALTQWPGIDTRLACVDVFTTDTGSTAFSSIMVDLELNVGTTSNNEWYGINSNLSTMGSNNYGFLACLSGTTIIDTSGTTTEAYGLNISLQAGTATGTITQIFGVYVQTSFNGPAIGSLYGLYVSEPAAGGTSSITNNYGLWLDNQAQPGVTHGWAIFSLGGNSYHKGSFLTNGTFQLSASGTTADTGISRTAANTLAVGNGTAGNASGTLSAAVLIENTTLSPTSAGTAGITGQLAWDTSFLYVCTSGGSAGSATWKKATLAAA